MCPVRSVTYVSGPDREELERAMGIEPTSEAWEASILPLYDARSSDKASKRNRAPQGLVACAVRVRN